MGGLLAKIVDETLNPDKKVMPSVFLLFLGENDAGRFYALATTALDPANAAAKFDFWLRRHEVFTRHTLVH